MIRVGRERSLIITDRADYSFLAQLQWIKRHCRNFSASLDFYVVTEDNMKKARQKCMGYEVVYLFCGQTFYLDYPNVLREFERCLSEIRNFHGGDPYCLSRYAMRKRWEESGVAPHQPRIEEGKHFFSLPEGWSFPYLIRGNYGHSDDSCARLVYTEEEAVEWLHEHSSYPYVFEEFIDTSIDGEFWDARVVKVGNKIYPEMIKWSTYWNPPHAPKSYTKHFKKGSLRLLEEKTQTELPLDSFLPYFEPFKAEIAALDFSIDRNHNIVPWEIISNFALYDSECAITDDEITDQQQILNNALACLNIDYVVSKNDIRTMLESMISLPDATDGDHTYKEWNIWSPYQKK